MHGTDAMLNGKHPVQVRDVSYTVKSYAARHKRPRGVNAKLLKAARRYARSLASRSDVTLLYQLLGSARRQSQAWRAGLRRELNRGPNPV